MSCVLDPTEREEMVMVGALTVVLNQHGELCAVQTAGRPIEAKQLMESMSDAALVAPMRLALLEGVLAAHGLELAAAAEVLRRTGRVANARAAVGDAGVVLPAAATAGEAATVANKAARIGDEVMAPPGASGAEATAVAPPGPGTGGARAKKKKKKRARADDEDDDEEETVTVTSAFA